MNESILRALMRLFAIVTDINHDGQADNKRDIVMDYLDRQYSHEVVQKYIRFYDDQVRHFHPEPNLSESDMVNKKLKAEDRIIELCDRINIDLEHEQKVIVVAYLLDFICSGDNLTSDEVELVRTMAEHLKIEEDEFLDIRSFTFRETEKVIHQDWLFVISADAGTVGPGIKHLTIRKLEGQIDVLYVPSSNTYLFRYEGGMSLLINGHLIKPGRTYVWPSGAVIRNPRIGSIYYIWVVRQFIQSKTENPFVFTAEDISFRYFNSTNGVKRFTMKEESGRLVGIIGGSGSGKSTLLNVLNGNLKPQKGSITINGWDIHKNQKLLQGVIGYVPQDDLLIKELTVFQNLYFNARLCFSDYSEVEIREVVENALFDFDLVEARDLNVGDAFTTILSGGQRKRLNIAIELIREPSILFIDEPTSGLSSADTEKIMTLLKRQTFKGRLIIANIHQPSSDVFKALDKLLVMDQGGRVIYYGHPVSAITYFKTEARYADAEESECLSCGNINPDQILRIVEARVVDANGRLTRKRKTSPEEWYQKYLEKLDVKVKQIERTHDSSVPRSYFKIPGHFQQFVIFLKRDLLAKFHNKQYLMLLALEAPMLALILSFFSKNYTFEGGLPRYDFGTNAVLPAYLFMSVIVALFLGLIISAEEIFKDRKILKREKFLNLSRSSYLFSKVSILFMISALQSLAFVLIGNSMLEIRGMLFRYWVILFTTSCWANMVGLNISSGFNSVITIYILVPLILVPQLLFSGVVVEFDKMHNKITNDKVVPIIGDVVTSRWAYEAMAVTQFKDNPFEKRFYEAEAEAKNTSYYRSFAIPELKDILEETDRLYDIPTDTQKYFNNLSVLRNEISRISRETGLQPGPFADSLERDVYQPHAGLEAGQYLDDVKRVYISRYNRAVAKRDSLYNSLVEDLGNSDNFIRFKQKYYNDRLASVLTNEDEIMAYRIHDGEMIPVRDAIYRKPERNSWRAQFYAPLKYFFGIPVDTFYFNLAVIWMFSGIWMILLYYDVLKKILVFFEAQRINRRNKIRFSRLIKMAEQSWPKRL